MIHLHFDRLYPTCLIFGERFCPTFSIIPINSSKKMPLPLFKGCFDVSSLFFKDLSVDVRGGRNSLQCRRILAGRNLVRVRDIVVAAIFDFMTVEDWGE